MKRSILALLALHGISQAQTFAPQPSQFYVSSPMLRRVSIDRKLGAQAPLTLPFVDELGRSTSLSRFTGKPVILALVYYQCPSLCNMVLNGVLRSVKALTLNAGEDYNIVAVSFDPRETPEMARAKKQTYLTNYNRPGTEQGWHFLTGTNASSLGLAEAVGFHYAFDAVSNQYAHGSAIMLLTPEGRVSKYFFGIDYPARDLRLGLVEASNGRIGTAVDQVMLYCYHYDPSNGRYGLVVMNALRLGGLLTLGALASFVLIMLHRDFRTGGQQGSVT